MHVEPLSLTEMLKRAQTEKPARRVADGLLVEGLTILYGPPKCGKSSFALNVGLAVASGEKFLGRKTHHGQVLYISLQDKMRKVNERIVRIRKGGAKLSDDFFCQDHWLPGRAGLKVLGEWLRGHPRAALAIIDTLGEFRDPTEITQGGRIYDIDRETAIPIRDLALKHHVCILVVFHTRKAPALRNPLESVQSTYGLPAIADTNLIMQRTYGQRWRMDIASRDIDQTRLMLEGNIKTFRWSFVSKDEMMSGMERRLLDAMKKIGEPATANFIAENAGTNKPSTRVTLHRMYKAGKVGRRTPSTYELLPEREDRDE